MLVECPNCHRRYEPKPNEKYCPCCGEEITTPLKAVGLEHQSTKETSFEKKTALNEKKNIGRWMSLLACIIAFLSFVFMFGPLFHTGSSSVFILTFAVNEEPYVGMVIAFLIYFTMFSINIYATVSAAKNNANGSRIAVGVLEVFLILFYTLYLTYKFKTMGSYAYPFGEGLTGFLLSLGISALLNFIAPAIDKF